MSLSSIATAFGGIAAGLDQTLFQTALANLNWSRGYLWYVTLSDVPNPFQETGVIKLPVTEVTYEIADTKEFTWEGSMQTFAVPQRQGLRTVNLTMYDDEQCTMCTFFERWYNAIYGKGGVLPVTEASKFLKVTKMKSTRKPATKYYRRNDILEPTIRKSDSRWLYVFPTGPMQEVLNSDNNPRVYNIKFVVVHDLDADYGDPSKHDGFSIASDKVQGFLDKVADYI